MALPRLPEQVALRVVRSALDGVSGAITTLEHSYGRVDHKLSCDALVFKPDPTQHDGAGVDLVRLGAAHREAAELWFAVSCCPGYAFQDNREFWWEALPLDLNCKAVLAVGEIGYAFPRLVLSPRVDSDFYFSRSTQLEDFLRGFFGLRSAVTMTRSEHFRVSMDLLGGYMPPERGTYTIQVVLDMTHVVEPKDDPQRVVALVHEVLRSLTATVNQIPVVLHSIRIDNGSLGLIPVKTLLVFDQLPADVQIDFEAPFRGDGHIEGSPGERCVALQSIGGASDTQYQGRLRELDMMYCVDIYLSALCSLLPFSQSLELLVVRPTTTHDWLWVGYAMFHPRARQTQWKALRVRLEQRTTVDFEYLERCKRMNAWSRALATNHLADNGTDQIKVTAVRTKTAVLHLKGGERVTLAQGHRVEVCGDGNWASGQQNRTSFVNVIVAGIGVGRIHARSLEIQPILVGSHPPEMTCCLTSLKVEGSFEFARVERMAWLLTPGLEELNLTGFRMVDLADVAKLPSTLTTIKCSFPSDIHGVDVSLPVWRNIQSLEVHMSLDQAEQLVDLLLQPPLRLKYLRLSMIEGSSGAVSASLRKKLEMLPLQMPSLLALSARNWSSTKTKWNFPAIHCGKSARAAKMAFLSVARQTQGPTAQDTALSLLGPDVLRHIFAFVGYNPDYFLFEDESIKSLFFAGRCYRVDNRLA